MLTLNATDTLSAVAGTASAVNYAFFGDVINPSDAFGGLPSGQLPSSVGAIWNATTGQSLVRLRLSNTTGSPVSGIKIFKNGTGAANQITGSFTIPANGTATLDDQCLAVWDGNGALIYAVPLSSATPQVVTVAASNTGAPGSTGGAADAGHSHVILMSAFDTQVRTSRLDQMAAPTAPVGLGSQKITTLADGSAATDAATVGQLSAALDGRKLKEPVACATTASISLFGEQTIDGVPTSTSRVCVKDQATPSQNGLYVSGAGAWTRSTDADTATELSSASVLVLGGTTNGGDTFVANTITTLGTDPVSFTKTGEGTTYTADGSTLDLIGSQFREKDGGTTNAKLASMASATFKGQTLGGSGAPVDLTAAQAKTALAIANTDVSGLGSASTQPSSAFDAAGAASTAQAFAIQRANHTGTQLASTISDFAAAALAVVLAGISFASSATITAADTILSAFGKLQAQLTKHSRKLSGWYDAADDFGFVGDLATTNGTTSMGAGTAILTDTSNPFTAADVGKRITVPRAGAGSSPNQAQLTTTILSFQNSGQVTLAAPSVNAVTNTSVHYGTDNSTAEAALVAAVNGRNGCKVFFGQSATNAYGFQTIWGFNKPAQIEGIGGGHTADTGQYALIGGTRLAWWGTSSDGGTAFGAGITFSPTGVQALKRVALRHIWIDGRNNDQNQLLYGVKLASCQGHMLEDFFVMDPRAQGIWLDIDSDPTEAKDTTRFSHRDICARILDVTPGATLTPTTTTTTGAMSSTGTLVLAAANNLPTAGYVWVMSNLGYPVLVRYTGGGGSTSLTGCTISAEDAVNAPQYVSGGNVVEAAGGNGGAYKLSGGTGANTCCGVIDMIQISYGTTWGPAAMEFLNSDSIEIRKPMMNGGSNVDLGAINRRQRPGVRFNGSNTNATLASRNNIIRGGDPGGAPGGPQGGCSSMGLNNVSAALSFPAGPNYWFDYELGNGAPIPVVEGNAILQWERNGGFNVGETGSTQLTDITAAASASTIIAQIKAPPQGIQIGLLLELIFTAVKTTFTAATANVIGVKIGPLGTLSDPTVNSFSLTPTAVVDIGTFLMQFAITGTLGAACTSVMNAGLLSHQAAINAGHATTATMGPAPGTPVTFNSAQTGLIITFFVTLSAGTAWTIRAPFAPKIVKGANP